MLVNNFRWVADLLVEVSRVHGRTGKKFKIMIHLIYVQV